jgi:hypothetical protein
MLDLELDEAGNKPRCERLGLWNQRELDSRMEQWGQVESKLGKLSETLNENVATAYCNDVDKVIKKRKESGVLQWIGIQRLDQKSFQGNGILVYRWRKILWMRPQSMG